MYNVLCLLSLVTYDVSIVRNPLGNPVPGTTNAFEYVVGTGLILTCSVIPPPPSDSEFSWSCSTGCFADMETTQIISVAALEEMDSGVISCSVVIDGMEYFSESFELQVMAGKKCITKLMVVSCEAKTK